MSVCVSGTVVFENKDIKCELHTELESSVIAIFTGVDVGTSTRVVPIHAASSESSSNVCLFVAGLCFLCRLVTVSLRL